MKPGEATPGKSEESSSSISLSCKQLKGFVNVTTIIASPILNFEVKVNSSSQSDKDDCAVSMVKSFSFLGTSQFLRNILWA